MKFEIERASGKKIESKLFNIEFEIKEFKEHDSIKYFIFLNTLEDLINLSKEFDRSIVFNIKDNKLTIYDGYLE